MLAVGDALKRHKYFDHAPELELVYHLRNGIAHGNRFTFTTHGRERLAKYPADNRDAALHMDICEIKPELGGASLSCSILWRRETSSTYCNRSKCF